MCKNYLYAVALDTHRGFLPRLIGTILLPLSFLYGAVIRSLIAVSRLNTRRIACKVISVGNITLGGTGKTVVVEAIAGYLKGKGQRVAILTRGYKRLHAVSPASQADYRAMGDEPYMLQENLLKTVPVIVDADRLRAARHAIRDFGAEAVILDDGFQQWKIKKDLEIVTIDAVSAFGNRHMIPRGILREPLIGLGRADIFMLTNADGAPSGGLTGFLSKSNPRALIVESVHSPIGFYRLGAPQPLSTIESLKGKTVALLSGIGNPDSFERSIKRLGLTVGAHFRFPDHHSYSPDDMDEVRRRLEGKAIDTLVTTQKDSVRLLALDLKDYSFPVMVLRIALKITKNEEAFYNRLRKLYTA